MRCARPGQPLHPAHSVSKRSPHTSPVCGCSTSHKKHTNRTRQTHTHTPDMGTCVCAHSSAPERREKPPAQIRNCPYERFSTLVLGASITPMHCPALLFGVSSLQSGIEFGWRKTGEGSSGEREGGGVRSGAGAARTILASYFFIPLVLGPLNSLVWWEVPLGYIALG